MVGQITTIAPPLTFIHHTMRFLSILIILVFHSCSNKTIPVYFIGSQYKVDCDTSASKFWVAYSAVHMYPKYVFDHVKIFESDSTIEYNIAAMDPPGKSKNYRSYLPRGYYIVSKKTCEVVAGNLYRPK